MSSPSSSQTSVIIEQYSEKAIVVRGNTFPYKEKLLSIGGKWNKSLRGGEGWIFPLKNKPIVEKALSEPPSVISENESRNDTSSNSYSNTSSSSKYKTPSKCYNDGSEVVLTKKEYLHLISRIERLEQLITENGISKISSAGQNSTTQPRKNKPVLPLLSSIDQDDIQDIENNCSDDEEERNNFKPLLRKKKH